MAVSIAQLFVGVSADTSRAMSELGSFQGSLRNIASQLESTGAGISTAISAPIAAVGGSVIKFGADFEHALNRVRKTTGLTREDTDKLGKGILDLSASTAGGAQSAEDLAKVAEVAGQLGIEGADNILNFTRIIAQFSLATGIAGDQAAAQLEAIRLLTGVGPGQLENISSTIVDLGNKTAATESQINEFALRLGGALHTAGASVQEVLGISATLASLQIDPEAGGTAISKFFIDMASAAGGAGDAVDKNSKQVRESQERLTDLSNQLQVAVEAQKAFGRNTPASTVKANADAIERYKREISDTQSDLAKLNSTENKGVGSAEAMARVAGLTTDQFKELAKSNPTAAFEAILKGLANIKSTEGPAAEFQALSDLGINDARQIRAILALAENTDVLAKNIDTANQAFGDNTAAAAENAASMEDTTNKFNLLLNQIKKVIIEGWDALRPAILEAMAAFQTNVLPVLDAARQAFAGLPEPTRNFAIALGAILVVLGPALVLFGLLAASVAAISLPVLLVAGAIALLAAAWIANLGGIRETTASVVAFIGDQIGKIAAFWEQNGPTITAAAVGALNNIFIFAGRILSFFTTVWVLIVTIAERALREVGAFFNTFLLPPIQAVGQWIGQFILQPLLELLRFIGTLVEQSGLGGALGGLNINDMIRQGEAAIAGLSQGISAGGPGTANSVVVNINNPTVPDQTTAERFAQQVREEVERTLIASEAASSAPAPLLLPGNPLPFGGPF